MTTSARSKRRSSKELPGSTPKRQETDALEDEIQRAFDNSVIAQSTRDFIVNVVASKKEKGETLDLNQVSIPCDESAKASGKSEGNRNSKEAETSDGNETLAARALPTKKFLLHMAKQAIAACRKPAAADMEPAKAASDPKDQSSPAVDMKLWRTLSISCYWDDGEGGTESLTLQTDPPEKIFGKINNKVSDTGEFNKGIQLALNGKYIWFHNPEEYLPSKVNEVLGLVEGKPKMLDAFLEKQMTPLTGEGRCPKLVEGNLLPKRDRETTYLIPPDLKYVDVDNDQIIDQWSIETQPDKAFATLVVGESGSGKSVYACLKPQEKNYRVVYCVITPDGVHKPDREFPHLEDFLRNFINEYENEKPSDSPGDILKKRKDAIASLCAIKSTLNRKRNLWVKRKLEKALERIFGEKSEDMEDPEKKNANLWFYDKWDYEQLPDKVAIVVDEATDPDLAEGLVACVRELTAAYRYLAKYDLRIVIAGTGLDGIRYPGRVGTNPEFSKMLTLKQPKLESLNKKLHEKELVAIKKGLFSKVMMTNARMFFRSVLPILTDPKHAVDDETLKEPALLERLQSRLIGLASCRELMDHGPRFYVNQNSVGKITDNGKRSDLLQQAFLYHLLRSIESSGGNDEAVKDNKERELGIIRALLKPGTLESDAENNIFSRGLAMRDSKKTSRALNYLACYGLTCQIRPTFGDRFEELTALHCLRLMECEKFETVKRLELKYAWPPKANEGDLTAKDIGAFRTRLSTDQSDELEEQEQELLELKGSVSSFGIVFSQGTASAQGGDVLVLRVRGVNQDWNGELESIQCKHYKASTVKKSWWDSLGVDCARAALQPKKGKAGYSYAGLDEFRGLLAKRLKIKVVLGKRTMAVSFPSPTNGSPAIPADRNGPHKDVRIWYKEMLEPTMSTFDLSEATQAPADPSEATQAP